MGPYPRCTKTTCFTPLCDERCTFSSNSVPQFFFTFRHWLCFSLVFTFVTVQTTLWTLRCETERAMAFSIAPNKQCSWISDTPWKWLRSTTPSRTCYAQSGTKQADTTERGPRDTSGSALMWEIQIATGDSKQSRLQRHAIWLPDRARELCVVAALVLLLSLL